MTTMNEFMRTTNGLLFNQTILAGYRGSVAHGMYIPNSNPNSIDDKDGMYIIVPALDHYFGLTGFGHANNGTVEIKEGVYDVVVYEARKFVRLLEQGNPNVLSLLWLEPEYYLKQTPAGSLLIANRKKFVGKHVYHSFSGYAYAQLHKMTHQKFEGYMGDKRKKLVEQFGYDTRNAAHLIRLLRMGIEFLGSGELQVLRPDAKQLLDIKHGEWSLEKVQTEAERLFKLSEEALVRSTLPVAPDPLEISNLCTHVVRLALSERDELSYT